MIRRRQLMAGGAGLAGAVAFGTGGMRSAHGEENGGWVADPEVVARAEADRPGFLFREDDVPGYELPDPLISADGSPVIEAAQWPARRDELLELFRREVYGRRPDSPGKQDFEVLEQDPAAMDGAATLRRIAVHTEHRAGSHQFELILFLPNAAEEAVPVFLLLNNRGRENTDPTREQQSEFWPAEQLIDRGYGIAALQVGELAPDDPETFTEGVIGLFDDGAQARPDDAWGALSAWGWGGSRALDYFETDSGVDAERVAVIGHSRGGKAALWAGAEDERFAMIISNDSGCGGAAISRRKFGETVAEINNTFPHWFCHNFRSYDDAEETLPVDQHELITLLAPRAVCVASADEDLWSDPRGEFLAQAHASGVYALLGDPEIDPDTMPELDSPLSATPRTYHIRRGGHDLTTQDWGYYADAADALWR